MGWISIIGTALKLILEFTRIFAERDKEKKKLKTEALNEVRYGLKKRDPSRVTAGFDRIKRI